MTTPLLDVRDLCVSYGRAQVVHNVSIKVTKGALVTVIGANGAGKTTLLNAIMGLLPRLKERRQQLAGTLSGGERQMLAMGRALMARPTLLMLDEPSLGLAPRIVRDIFHILTELRAGGVSILLVEQNARAALQVADYAYVMELGAITTQGEPAEIAKDERLVESYLGLGGNEY
jgi:branched-chain amino acid transport system ATP-binding protein